MAREMKDSGVNWIGSIPSSWDVIKFKYLFSIIGGNGFPDALQGSTMGDYPFCKVSDINGAGDYVSTASNWITHSVAEEYKYNIIPHNSIIMAKIGAALAKNHRKINSTECCIDNNTQALVPRRNDHIRFLLYLTKCIDMSWFDNNSTVPSINNSKLLSFFVPNVSYKEQAIIADYLDSECTRIDSVIDQTRVSIEEYKKLKQAVITQAVTKGIRPDRPMKDSGIEWIGEIPEEWEVKRTKYFADSFFKGNGITKEDIVENGRIPCVRYGEIYTKYNQSFDNCFSHTELERIASPQFFSKGDLLFTCTGELIEEIGKCVVYLGTEDCLAGGDIIVMKHSQDPAFMSYALNSNYAQAQKSCGKTKLKVVHISASEIKNVLLAFPPYEEQKEISEYLDCECARIDKLIRKKESIIAELEPYKKSLIYEYVTGKKEV